MAVSRRVKKTTMADIYPEAYIFKGNLRWMQDVYCVTDEELCKVTGCCQSTLETKRKEPWRFTVKDIIEIASLFDADAAQMLVKPQLIPKPKEIFA